MYAAQQKGHIRLRLDIFLLLCISAAIVLPIYFNGIPNGNDLPQHYQFALTYKAAVADGSIYPGWSADSNSGYGDVGIRFYPPFSYYCLVAAEAVTGNWYDASVLMFGLWFFIGGSGVYLWARESFSPNASLLAAACYIVAPYHVNQIFNAFTYAEFAAASILPFCFLFVTRICRHGRKIDILLLGLSYALLVLTHLPMTVIGSICLLAYSIASLRIDRIRTIFRLGASVGLGLLASSFYWVRMATELAFVNHSTDTFRSAAYDFHSNFLAAFLYVSPRDYDERSLWFSDLMLLVTLCLFLPGISFVLYRWRRAELEPLKASIITICVAIFFATPLSLPIWEHFVSLQQIQFPWRWLAAISLMSCFLAAGTWKIIADAFKSNKRPVAILAAGLLIACCVFTATQIIKPAVYTSRQEFTGRIDSLAHAKSYDCWWPVWAQESALEQNEKVLADGRNVHIDEWANLTRTFNIEAGTGQTARIATFYYPNWKAEVNGSPTEIERGADGTINIPIPQKEANIRLFFVEPNLVLVSRSLSLLTWLGLFLGIYASLRRDRKVLSFKTETAWAR